MITRPKKIITHDYKSPISIGIKASIFVNSANVRFYDREGRSINIFYGKFNRQLEVSEEQMTSDYHQRPRNDVSNINILVRVILS